MASNVEVTLAERGDRYGAFTGQAKYTQAIKKVLHSSPQWGSFADDQKEALEQIASKIARILNGDPNYSDSWHDIAGYAKLVEDRLTEVPVQPELNFRFTPVYGEVKLNPDPKANSVRSPNVEPQPPLGQPQIDKPASAPPGSILDGVKS